MECNTGVESVLVFNFTRFFTELRCSQRIVWEFTKMTAACVAPVGIKLDRDSKTHDIMTCHCRHALNTITESTSFMFFFNYNSHILKTAFFL